MKKLILLLVLLPCLLGAMNILISDSNQSHAETCSTYVQTYCPTATIEIILSTSLYALDGHIDYAAENGFDIISRSIGGMGDYSNNYVFNSGHSDSVSVVHAHGANTHVELGNPSYLGYIVAVGGVNTGSYGAGLEWFVNGQVAESWATATTTGMIAQLMIDHSWTFNQARQALRQTASNWSTGWIPDGGFGYIDYATADSLTTEELYSINCIYNIDVTENRLSSISIDWDDKFSSSWVVTSTEYPALNDTVSVSNYTMAHSIDDYVTFNIYPDSGRVESYSKVTAKLAIPVAGGAILRPNEDVGSGFTGWPSPFYTKVDEEVLSESDWIASGYVGEESYMIFGFPNNADLGVIDSLTVKAYINGSNSNDTSDIDVYLNTTRYGGIATSGSSSTILHEYTYSENPATLSAWTWEDVNDIQIYAAVYSDYDECCIRIHQLWIEVAYTPSAGGDWSNKICGVNNASTINGVAVENIQSINGVE